MDKGDPLALLWAHRVIGQLMDVAYKQRCTRYKAVPVYSVYQQDEISLWKLQLIAEIDCKTYTRTINNSNYRGSIYWGAKSSASPQTFR